MAINVEVNGEKFTSEPGKRVIELIKEKTKDTSEIICASVNGKMAELGTVVNLDSVIKTYTFNDPEGREVFWHSTSHVMAAAVKRIFPEVKVTIGPAIDEGFYYDFDKPTPFSDSDLPVIEAEMMKIIKEEARFERSEMPVAEAIKYFTDLGENYKAEIISEIKDPVVSLYKTGEFTDLCRGPHIGLAKKIKAVKLMKLAGAYWRGDEKNRMLQRIYGISFPKKEMLEEHLKVLEEAKLRDHRKIGKELDLFSTHEEFGPGLVYWHPKGGVVRKEMEDFWRNEHIKHGYDLVFSPHIAKIDLWNTSGHTGFYRDSMFDTMDIDKMQYQLKPMNCPFHILMYNSSKKSYRDLPLRWAELGTVYRYEKSGALHGLLRVRGFTQDDAHIFCREDQLEEEIVSALKFVMFILRTFGFTEFQVYLSTMPPDHIGEVAIWEKAQDALKVALKSAGLEYGVDEGGGAFYGPKIDVKIKDALNRVWQCSTIQVDFNLPQRFDINYIGKDGKEHRAIMIHRALMGSLERFFGVLIEHYKGAFPVWLSPYQAAVLTITERCDEYANEIKEKLMEQGIRVKMMLAPDKIGAKIREATLEKIPYMIILGDKEVETRTLSVRKRTGEEEKGVDLGKFLGMLTEKIRQKEANI